MNIAMFILALIVAIGYVVDGNAAAATGCGIMLLLNGAGLFCEEAKKAVINKWKDLSGSRQFQGGCLQASASAVWLAASAFLQWRRLWR